MIQVGVVGYGYWGPNIVRNFNAVPGSKVKCVCDVDAGTLARVTRDYPHMAVTGDIDTVLNDPEIDVVAIVTPVATHFELSKRSLENGKHVFVEKPFTQTPSQAEELIDMAEKKNLKIMVDHTFLFSGSVSKIKDLVDKGELGSIYYYDSTRINLGLFQKDVNVIWDLAPHDFAIMLHVLADRPEAVRVFSKSHVNHMEDVAHILVYFANNLMAHFNVNWLSPVKIRTTMIGGDKRMLLWNDIMPDEKIRIYDRGVNMMTREDIHDLMVNYRTGDMWSPKIDLREALFVEIAHFVECVLENKKNISDGKTGLEVVRLLFACEKSIKHNGGLVVF
ncbi:MAG: Gfo/Idh/MocA family oxidoreductase [Chitinispirillaceae bacterium]|nr:Gfo/Idh/MocA family oxidoreductase [Chitinispirillaceae bacterium]